MTETATERQAAGLAAHARLLAEAGALLHASLDPESTLQSLARLVVPAVADWCAIELAGQPPRQVAVAHVDPEKVRHAHELRRRWPPDPEATHGVPQVLRTGRPELVPEITDELLVQSARDPEHLAVARALGLRSYIVVPLGARGRILGALTLVNAESGRRFDADDLALAEDLARRAAVALDNAQLFADVRQTATRLELALQAGGMGTWEWDVATRRVHWSAAIEQMHGIPVGSFPGTFEAYQADIHPEDRERVLESITGVLESSADHYLLYRIVRPDGDVRWLEAHGRVLRDASGRPLKLVGVCTDVTRRQAAAEEARRLEHERRAAHEAALRADIALALNEGERLSDILHRSCEALAGHLDLACAAVWLADASPAVHVLAATAGAVTPPPGVTRIPADAAWLPAGRTDDAALLPAGARRLYVLPLQGVAQPLGLLGLFTRQALPVEVLAPLSILAEAIAQGIERSRAQEALAGHAAELQRSNAELQQFAYVASHDLQEPLRVVASYTQLLARRYRGRLDADADDFIEFIVDGVSRMQELINDLLTYSRVGTRGGEPAPVDCGAVLADVLANLRASIEQTGARVTRDALPRVQVDGTQLMQVFQNLIGNALKFHRPGTSPRVHVSATRDGDEWTLTVADDGLGIAPEFHDRVFVIFQRLHTRDRYPGNGIGLAVCKKIVERHGGRIWIESRPGEGASIHFTLPAAEEPRDR